MHYSQNISNSHFPKYYVITSNKFIQMKSLSMLNGQSIRNHALNNSPSKLGYSFSKLERFVVPGPTCPNAFYECDGKLSKRSAGFGYGDRYDFTKTLTSSPPATKYNPETTLFDTRRPDKGKTFGICREKSPENGTIVKGIVKNPGVGAYEPKFETTNNLCFSMRSRTVDVINKNNTSKASPGPAAYNHRDQFPHEKFSSGKYENPLLGKMSKTDRFTIPKESPGPQSYNVPDTLSNAGKYVVSSHAGNGTRRFSMTARTGFTEQFARKKSLNPGPGHYEKPSQFGVYGDSNYHKTSSSFGNIKQGKKGQ